MKVAALEAIATFLRNSGLVAPANSVEAARQRCFTEGDCAGGESFIVELKILVLALDKICAGLCRLNGQEHRSGGKARKTAPAPLATVGRTAATAVPTSWPPGSTWARGGHAGLTSALAAVPPASPHYVPTGAGPPGRTLNYDPSIPDQYRDDLDPGYRLQGLAQADLQRYRRRSSTAGSLFLPPGSIDAVHVPYANSSSAACFCASSVVSASATDAVAADDDDELFNAGDATPSPNRAQPVTPRLFPGSMNSLGVGSSTAGIGDLVVDTADHQSSASMADVVADALSGSTEISGAVDVPEFGGGAMKSIPTFGDLEPPAPASFGVDGSPMSSKEAKAPRLSEAVAPRLAEVSFGAKHLHDAPLARREEDSQANDKFYPTELDGIIYECFTLRVVYERDHTGFEERRELPLRADSVVAARYRVLGHLGAATSSCAVKCLDLRTRGMVCMKVIKNSKEFLDQALDEIKLLRLVNASTPSIDEKHCLRLIDHLYYKEHLIIVTELLQENLYDFSRLSRERGESSYFTLGRLQRISQQLLTALEYIHGLSIIHADLKPENILLSSYAPCEVKLIDFGTACFISDDLTSYVQSRSYRAPEVILGLPYSENIDVWSLGCVVAELWTGYMLFQNDSVQSLLARVIGILGPFPAHMMATGKLVSRYFLDDGRLFREVETEPEARLPGTEDVPERQALLYLPKRTSLRQRMRSDDNMFVDFLSCLLHLDPACRPTAAQALQHPWLSPGQYADGLQ